ncbi:MAG: TonB-dependent receptor [Prolixibacteraceae bacterium]
MRVTFILVCCLVFYASASTYSQNTRFTLNYQNATILDLIKDIESQSKFIFLYQISDLNLNKKVNADFKNAKIEEILDVALKGEGLTYEVFEKQILISKEERGVEPGVQSTQQPQKKVLTGTVKDNKGLPLPGVTVMVKGTTTGLITDTEGNFRLLVPSDAVVLIFSFVGMKSQEIQIAGKTTFHVVLAEETVEVNDVIVVGYAKQKRDVVVGAISDVQGRKLREMAVPNLSRALQELMPGVIGSVSSGQPGADDGSLTIRGVSTFTGSNSPLILVDGIEDAGGFSRIGPNEVSSISVLKDASATAIYGVRGANGVILITTRRGEVSKPTITVSGYTTLKMVTSNPPSLNGLDALILQGEASKNAGQFGQVRSEAVMDMYRNPNRDPILYPDVNWYDLMVKKVGWENNAQINVTGGTDFVKYFSSLSYSHQGDMFKTDTQNGFYDPSFWYDKINFRTNLDFNITKSTFLSTDISGRTDQTNESNAPNTGADFYNLYKDIVYSSPVLFPAYYPASFITEHPDPLDPNATGIRLPDMSNMVPVQRNPYYDLNYTGFNRTKADVVNLNLALHQNLDFFTRGLNFDVKYAYSTSISYKKSYANAVYNYMFDKATNTWSIVSGQNYNQTSAGFHPTSGEDFSTSIKTKYYEAKFTYDRTFKNHNLGVLGVFSRKETEANIIDFPSYKEDWVGRITYNFATKYLFEVNAGYNGSEKFAPGKRFGFFPSAAAGWNLAKEDFFKSFLPKVNQLKFRYTIGKSGSENGNRFMYEGGWGSYGTSYSNLTGFGIPSSGAVQSWGEVKIANNDATWEKAYKQNLGIDLVAFASNLTFSLELYKERREDIFVTPLMASYFFASPSRAGQSGSALSLPLINLGKTKSRGLEMVVSFKHELKNGLLFNIGGDLTMVDNRIVARSDAPLTPEYQKDAGKPIGWSSGYQTNGFFNDFEEAINAPNVTGGNMPGSYRYADFSGNGSIDIKDMVPFKKTAQPDFTCGLNFGASFKGFALSGRLFGKEGTYYGATYQYWYPNLDNGKPQGLTVQLDHWTPENKNAAYPSFSSITQPFYTNRNDRNFVDCSFLRLQSLTLNYLLTTAAVKKILHMTSARLYVTGNNLFTWSKVPFGDPEGGNAFTFNYPLVRRITFGIDMNF